jgi:hypothetical protein
MLSSVVTWILKALAAVALSAIAVVLILSILLALNVWIFHVPLSTR